MIATPKALEELFDRKYSRPLGWAPRLRQRFGYYSPDDVYEATVSSLVHSNSVWLDVGCGLTVFPHNPRSAQFLSQKCQLLVGLDPSDNIHKNTVVHQRVKDFIENFRGDTTFDLVTMRMVAEHISNPLGMTAALSHLVKPGGRVVIYTVYKWAPVALMSALIPFRFHHPIRTFFSGGDEDAFPTVYLMNTRKQLQAYFKAPFQEESFTYLDDCRIPKELEMAKLHGNGSLENIKSGPSALPGSVPAGDISEDLIWC